MTLDWGALQPQVDLLLSLGFSQYRIAKELDIKERTLNSRLRSINEKKQLPPKEKQSKRIIKGRKCLLIKRFIHSNPFSTAQECILACELQCSPRTLGRYLAAQSFVVRTAKPRLLLSAKNRQERVNFALRWLSESQEMRDAIVFSDETMVKSWPNGEVVMYRVQSTSENDNTLYLPMLRNGGTGVMFWGCAGMHSWGPLTVVNGSMNHLQYIDIIHNLVLPEMAASSVPLLFQQDNARPHTAKATQLYMALHGLKPIKWPAYSPDLSPIELCWNQVKRQFKRIHPRPTRKSDIVDQIFTLWGGLTDVYRVNTFGSFTDRLRACVQCQGEIIK